MSESSVGVYSLSLTSDSGRQRTYSASVELRPEVFVTASRRASAARGTELRLRCDTLPGVSAKKRLWRKDGAILVGDERVRVVGPGREELAVFGVKPGDAGTYSCAAVTDFGQDIVEFFVSVVDKEVNNSTGNGSESQSREECRGASQRRARIISVSLVGNDSALVQWEVPELPEEDDNNGTSSSVELSDCFEKAVLSLWTNGTDSSFEEMDLVIINH